jgi:hypothetical protein
MKLLASAALSAILLVAILLVAKGGDSAVNTALGTQDGQTLATPAATPDEYGLL